MAGLRGGALGVCPPINECRSKPALGREWGIDEPSMKLAGGKERSAPLGTLKYGGMTFSLYRHPRLLIPASIDKWSREYDYAGKNYSIVPYLDRHPCAVEAMEIYETAVSHFRG